MHKAHLKSYVFEILFIRDYSSTFISLMAKFEVYIYMTFLAFFVSLLEHLDNDIHFAKTFSIPLVYRHFTTRGGGRFYHPSHYLPHNFH